MLSLEGISLVTRSSSEALVRTSDIYELAIADVAVAANAVGVAQSDVTDLRSNSELCGLCGAVVAGHKHSTDDVSSGVLPVTRGGTGSATAADALDNLGAAPAVHKHSATDITSGTLPVSRGGTGATNNAGLWSAAASGGIIYSSSTPTVVNGKIWLKPI